MICVKTPIPRELNEIDDELKAIYHSKDSVCFFIFKRREDRNQFVDVTQGMDKDQRMKTYEKMTQS
jgi:hypothetical protein